MTIDDGIGGGRRNFKVVQKLAALRPVYEIYDEQTGERIATGRRTWMSFLRSTIHFEDEQGNRILTAKGGFFDKTFWLYDESGGKIAKLTRPWIALRKNFTIYYRDDFIKAQAGFLPWGFEALRSDGTFAFRLDKKIIAIRDQSRVSVGDYMPWLHAVSSAVVVDQIFFKTKGCGATLICCLLPVVILLGALFGLMMLASLLGLAP